MFDFNDGIGISEMESISEKSVNESVLLTTEAPNLTLHFTETKSFDSPFNCDFTKILFIVAYGGVFSICFFGNLMVLFAIVKSARLRSMTNFFLANLAMADFCVGVFCVLPNLATFLSPPWLLGKVMCKVYYFVWNLSYTASIIILTAIATERYIAIKFPLRARRCLTTRRLTLSQIGIWLIAAIYNIPYLIVFDTIPIRDGTKDVEFCFYVYHIIDMKTLTTVNFVVWYVIPLLSMLIMYSNIGRALWRTGSTPNFQKRLASENIDESLCTNSSNSSDCPNHNINLKELSKKDNILQGSDKVSFKKIRRNDHICAHCASQRGKSDGNGNGVSINGNDSSSAQRRSIVIGITSGREGSISTRHRLNSSNTSQIRMSSTRAIRSRRKVIRLLVAVVVSFALCVLPHHVRLLLIYWNITSTINAGLFPPLSFLILYFNSALNPVLYALFSANFRKSFREIMPCKFRRRPLSFLMLDTKSEGYR